MRRVPGIIKEDGRRPDVLGAALAGPLERQAQAVGREGVRSFLRLSIRQTLGLAGTIGTDPVKTGTISVDRAKDDVLSVRRPNRAAVGAGTECQTVGSAAIQILHPNVVLLAAVHRECQALTVRREAR